MLHIDIFWRWIIPVKYKVNSLHTILIGPILQKACWIPSTPTENHGYHIAPLNPRGDLGLRNTGFNKINIKVKIILKPIIPWVPKHIIMKSSLRTNYVCLNISHSNHIKHYKNTLEKPPTQTRIDRLDQTQYQLFALAIWLKNNEGW